MLRVQSLDTLTDTTQPGATLPQNTSVVADRPFRGTGSQKDAILEQVLPSLRRQ